MFYLKVLLILVFVYNLVILNFRGKIFGNEVIVIFKFLVFLLEIEDVNILFFLILIR